MAVSGSSSAGNGCRYLCSGKCRFERSNESNSKETADKVEEVVRCVCRCCGCICDVGGGQLRMTPPNGLTCPQKHEGIGPSGQPRARLFAQLKNK